MREIKTSRVRDRRTLRFASLDDVLADLDRLERAKEIRRLGNWSPGQILDHLARTFHSSFEPIDYRPSWPIRLLAPLAKRWVLTRPMSPGFRLPAGALPHLGPEELPLAEGIAKLRGEIASYRATPERTHHVIFGPLTATEWDQLHLRHTEMHLSFLDPRGE